MGHFTIGGVTRSHIEDPKFSIGRLVRRSFPTGEGWGMGSGTRLGVIKLRPNPVRYHFLCFVTRSSPCSERSPPRV
jgi:hypothetical protein